MRIQKLHYLRCMLTLEKLKVIFSKKSEIPPKKTEAAVKIDLAFWVTKFFCQLFNVQVNCLSKESNRPFLACAEFMSIRNKGINKALRIHWYKRKQNIPCCFGQLFSFKMTSHWILTCLFKNEVSTGKKSPNTNWQLICGSITVKINICVMVHGFQGSWVRAAQINVYKAQCSTVWTQACGSTFIAVV